MLSGRDSGSIIRSLFFVCLINQFSRPENDLVEHISGIISCWTEASL